MEIIQTLMKLLMTVAAVVGLGISILTFWELVDKRIAKLRRQKKSRAGRRRWYYFWLP